MMSVLVATALLGSVSLIYPFARDHGIHAFIAEMAMHGKLMYRDILMGVMPMTVVVHELALTVFGRSMTAIRILDLFWTMATAALVFAFVRRAFKQSGLAVIAGVMYSFLYYLFDYWNTAQNDGFLNLPVAAAFVCVAAAQNPVPSDRSGFGVSGRWLAAGSLIGLALLFKQTVGLLVPGLAVFALTGSPRKRAGNWVNFVLFGAGVVTSLVLALLLMLTSHALPGFIEGQLRMAVPYSRLGNAHGGLFGRALEMIVKFFQQPDLATGALLGMLGLVFLLARLLRRESGDESLSFREFRLPALLVLTWFLAALASVYVQGKFFLYHYLPLLPALAILAALALSTFFEWVAIPFVRGRSKMLLFGAAGLGLLICTSYTERFQDMGRLALGENSVQDYWYANIHNTPEFSLAEQMTVADYLRESTPTDARVFVWGVDPLVNFLARRQTVSRFIYNHPLVAVWAWPGYRVELMRALAADMPEVFVTEHNDATPWVMGHDLDSYQSLMEFPELRDFVVTNYELETRIGRFDILRRAGADSTYPSVSYPPGQLAEDLSEAVRFVAAQDSDAYRTVLWPGSLRTVPRSGIAAPKLMSYHALERQLWLEETKLADILPAMSIWVRNDSSPFAALEPFSYQNDGEHYISNDFRFTMLHECRNRRVLVYRVSERSGNEFLKPHWQIER